MAAQRPPTGLDPFSALQYMAGDSFNGTIPPHMAHLFGPPATEPLFESTYRYTRLEMQTESVGDGDRFEEVNNGEMMSGTDKSKPLDFRALSQRLRTLGLHDSSDSLLPPTLPSKGDRAPITPRAAQPFSPTSAPSPRGLASAYQTKPTSPARPPHLYPPVTELGPSDSISMYKPAHPPSAYGARSARRGGTNVDRDREAEEYESEYEPPGTQAADWETHNYAPSDAPSVERMTMAPGPSEWTTGTLAGNMYTMRDRLINADLAREIIEQEGHQDAIRLSNALAKLEMQEQQIRDLKANLIAQQVAKTQAEISTEDYRDCKNELASAVRALRRAREENKKTDEERRRLAKCFEETKTQLFKYHEELKVRDARAKGREEGRAEACLEAERWMGGSPPIPVDPVQSLPQAVLHQTPQAMGQQLQQPQPFGSAPPVYATTELQPSGQRPPLQAPPPMQMGPGQSTTPQPFQQQQQPVQVSYPQQHQQATVPYPQQQPQPYPFQQQPAMEQPLQTQHTAGHQSQHPPQMLHPQPTGTHIAPQPLQPQHTAQTPAPTQPQVMPQGYAQMPTGGVPVHGTPILPPMNHAHPIPVAMPVPVPVQVGGPVLAGAVTSVPIPNGPIGGTPFHGDVHQQYNASHSVPHRPTALPVQHAPRAGTVININSSQPGAGHRRHASESIPRQRAPTTIRNSVRAPAPASVSRHHAADSYLDRAEHDPRIQQMLSGTPAKTIHTSAVGTHQDDTRGLRSQDTTHKPLPVPGMDSISRAQTLKAPTSAGGTSGKGHNRRFSLMEGLHAHSHTRSQLADEGPYPVFPRGGPAPPTGRGHSRQSSMGSVNPANYALPASVAPSLMQTPAAQHDHLGGQSVRTTPAAKSFKSRSRVAGALRGGTEIGEGELSNIEEEPSRVYPAMNERNRNTMGTQTPHAAPSHMGHATPKHVPQHPPQQELYQAPVQHMPQPRQPPMPQRYAPSMPPMRSRPTPRMPAPLGAGGKAASEHHPHDPQVQRGHMANMYGKDLAAALTERLASPAGDLPYGAHDQCIPPGLAPQAVSGGIEGVGGPRHSALGLDFQSPKSHRTTGTNMKAPTIMIQPPSSRDDKSGIPTRFASPATAVTAAPTLPRSTIVLDTPPAEKPSRRQTTIITEYFDPPTPPGPQAVSKTPAAPHNVPLPKSQPHAPTAYSKSPGATTMGLLSPPDTVKSGGHRQQHHRRTPTQQSFPSVNIIDYAMRQPLPASRPTTMFIDPAGGSVPAPRTVTVQDDPDSGRSKKQSSGSGHASGHASGNGNGNGNGRAQRRKPVPQDPRQVPLPASRAPTNRAKGSQYAATVATIEEVTEEESGRENRVRRR